MQRQLRKCFTDQRFDATRRGIGFLFSFEEWLAVWTNSGHLHERGSRCGQYVMARHGDKGNYELGNVAIVSVSQNNSEAHKGKPKSKQMRKRLSQSRTGLKVSPFSVEARKHMSEAHKDLVHSKKSIAKMRRVAKTRPRNDLGEFVCL